MISLICPSRGRPQKSFETISKWIRKAGVELEVILSLDVTDPELTRYYQLYKETNAFILTLDNKNAVEAINNAAKIAKGNIFIVVSDDSDCCSAWAIKILKATEGKSDFVLKVRDGIQPKIITMPVLDKIYYQRDGYIYNPEYDHAWADREFSEVAYKRKRVITKNILFRHLHYSVLKDKRRDAQYEKTDATFNSGKQIFLRRQKINFGL
jgi:hypothetical protein